MYEFRIRGTPPPSPWWCGARVAVEIRLWRFRLDGLRDLRMMTTMMDAYNPPSGRNAGRESDCPLTAVAHRGPMADSETKKALEMHRLLLKIVWGLLRWRRHEGWKGAMRQLRARQ